MSVVIQNISDNNNLAEPNINASVVSSKDLIRNFGQAEDVVELHIYTPQNELLISKYDHKGYRLPDNAKPGETILVNQLIFEPDKDLQEIGFSYGKYISSYNILRRKIINSVDRPFFIKEISADRKEIRLVTNLISNAELETSTLSFIYEFQNSSFYREFLLNFGSNNFSTGVNIALDKNTLPFSILIKLIDPLSSDYGINTTLWIQEALSVPYKYETDIFPDNEDPKPLRVKPPNFDINVEDHIIKSSDYYNIDNLYQFSSLSSYRELLNKLKEKNIKINVDYTDFSNFVHYSSAVERLNNFRYKISVLEGYNNDLTSLSNIPGYTSSVNVSSSVYTIDNNINDIIKGFDGYESYLYYESSSFTWPKSNSQRPYILYNTTSSQALTWFGSYDNLSSYFGGVISTASVYDLENIDNLVYSVPQFIRDDENNESYLLFLNMIGQHFDNIWLYIRALSDIHKANNNINEGISKDLVFYALKSLGMKVYNSESDTNIFEYFLGSNQNGNYNPLSSSFSTLITSSAQTMPGELRHKEILKRIYHNVPLLLKSKGTNRGIKALITTFGIPSTILDVLEYGGSDKANSTLEYNYDRFTYALKASGSYNIKIAWSPLTQNAIKTGFFNVVGDTIEFRFKPDRTVTYYTQSLFNVNKGSTNNALFGARLQYTSSNGYPYGNISFILSGSAGYTSASILNLPIWVTQSDGQTSWWNVMVRRRNPNRPTNLVSQSQVYDIYVKNEVGGLIGHQGSASLNIPTSSASYNYSWMDYGNTSSLNFLYLGGSGSSSIIGNNFQGQLQEFRLWSNYVSESSFNYHVLNPESYQGDVSGSAYNDLAIRFTLGNNLLTYDHSLSQSVFSTHPNQTIAYSSGSFFGGTLYGSAIYGTDVYGGNSTDGSGSIIINSNSASLSGFYNENNYISFVETYFANVPNTAYSNPVTEKIRIQENIITGSVLKHDLRLEQDLDTPLTKDTNLIDVSLSPQNEINKDIIAQYGDTFNIDNLIGNPYELSSGSYQQLDRLEEQYFLKYLSDYNYKDYIRLIDFFNNSLFKMIEDFVPMRSSLNTGISIKPNIIERSKVKIKDLVITNNEYTMSIGTHSISEDRYNLSHVSDQRDNYTGDYSGSIIDVNDIFTSGNFNPYLEAANTRSNFEHSDFNVLLNNVSSSRSSYILRTVDNDHPSVTYISELQDSYTDYERHKRPRRDGSKSTSLKYNVYTPATESYEGDDSYDKRSAIDFYARKFAFFSEVVLTGSTLPSRSNAYIKYLIDESGSVIELTKQNKNLFEVQNIYKTLTDADVSLLDNQNPTYQKSLDGLKSIYAGGFRYSAIMFNDSDNPITGTLLFNAQEETTTQLVGLGGVVAGGFNTFYLTSSGQVGRLNYPFDYTGSTLPYFNTDGAAYDIVTSKYVVPQNGNYTIFCNFNFRVFGNGSPTIYMSLKVNIDGFNYIGTDYIQVTSTVNKVSGSCVVYLNNLPLVVGQKISASVFLDSYHRTPGPFLVGAVQSIPGFLSIYDPNRTTFVVTSTVGTLSSGSFIVDTTDRRYVSCSQFLSQNYGGIKFKGYSPNKYDDIEYDWTLEAGDLIRFATGSMITNDLEFEVAEVTLPANQSPTSNDRVIIRLSNYVPLNVNTDYFVVVKKIPDETNVVLKFAKRYGQSSSGLLIPGNLDPKIRERIADIIGPIKGDLLSKVLIVGR